MSPFFGYLTACSYRFMWMAVGISTITAIGVYVQFWVPGDGESGIPASLQRRWWRWRILVVVRLYGEIEFGFAMIKVTTIIVMIVIGLAATFFGLRQWRQSIGFSNLTEHGGFFAVAGAGPYCAVYCGGADQGVAADRHYCR
ncbi:hypothetical protein ACLK1S_23565 [Escherichia coli]